MEKKDVLDKMMMICSKAEKCSGDIRLRVRKCRLQEEDENWVIERLQEENFLSDERFARHFINDKLRINRWGKMKIRYALRLKEIPESVYNPILDEIDILVYLDILKELLGSYSARLKEDNAYKRRAKILRFGQQRGFESELINTVLDKEGF